MANVNLTQYFNMKSVYPSSLEQDNIIQFSYQSPAGVHDKKPVVLVIEKRLDRFYGINLNYDMSELNEAITNMENHILPFLEKEYYKKYPDNKKKLEEQHIYFNKSLITEKEYKEFMRRYNYRDLEQFEVQNKNMNACRLYLYNRMNSVVKLVWKV